MQLAQAGRGYTKLSIAIVVAAVLVSATIYATVSQTPKTLTSTATSTLTGYTTETETESTTITVTRTTTIIEGSYALRCVVTVYQVEAIAIASSVNGSVTFKDTSTTLSKVEANYTTVTALQQTPGYTTSTSTTIQGTSTTTGPLISTWNSTVCTWLP